MFVAKTVVGPWHLAVRKTPKGALVTHCGGRRLKGLKRETLPNCGEICARCAKAIAANLGVD